MNAWKSAHVRVAALQQWRVIIHTRIDKQKEKYIQFELSLHAGKVVDYHLL